MPVGRPSSTGFRYLETFRDRLGKQVFYFRVGHGRRIKIRAAIGTQEFKTEYETAFRISNEEGRRDSHIEGAEYPAGSLGGLINDYLKNGRYLDLAERGKHRNRYLNELLEDYGFQDVASMGTRDIQNILYKYKNQSGTYFNLRKTLNVLLEYGTICTPRWLENNPVEAVPNIRGGEHRDWQESEIEQFQKYWVIGTEQRTIFDLYLYTGQRTSDIRKMKWSHLVGTSIYVHQVKQTGKNRKRKKLLIKIHRDLGQSLAKWPTIAEFPNDYIIIGDGGGEMPETSWRRVWTSAIASAGLPADCKPHGLRKAMARRLAEVGCSASQIQAITGHEDLKELERYCRAASQKLLAADAISMLESKLAGR